MADIKVNCPHCGQSLEGDEKDICGQTITCPSCNGEIIIPASTPTPPTPKVATNISKPSPPPSTPTDPNEEQEIFELKPSAKAFLGSIILGIILIPLFFIGIIILLNVWYRVATLRYRLTSQRLFIQKGLIAKHLEELELFRVKDITLKQGILQRILGFGSITVLSTDDSNPHIELIGINEPMKIKEVMRSTFRAARKQEGVRTAEVIHS